MNAKILSVIIPIYNSEKYLRRCLDSILNQGLKQNDYEIILVNDGSVDGSLKICEDYQQKLGSDFIKVVNQSNQGVSVARNNGLNVAQGDYVNFIDSDDYLIPGGLNYLINNHLDESVDILSYWSLTLDRNTYKTFKENYKVEGKVYFDKYGLDFLTENHQTSVVTSLFKRDFLISNDLKFNNLCIGEDVMFNLRAHLKNPRLRLVTSRIYRYDLHLESAIHNRNYTFTRKALDGYLYLLSFITEKREEYKQSNSKLSLGFQRILEDQFSPFMSRVLSSDLSVREMLDLRRRLKEKHILPFENRKKSNRIINFVFKSARLIKIYQFFFQRIFIPFVFPHINRN